MRIAYLINAHTDPNQLERLVNALYNEENDFYIHIDKKSDLAPFLCMPMKGEHIYFIENRIKVYWAGYSQIKVLMKLLKKCLEKEYDRVVYLSGLDYPIWSNEKIERFWTENPLTQYCGIYDVTNSKNETAINKINHYAFWDIGLKNERLFNHVRKLINNLLAKIPKDSFLRVDGNKWNIYWGSQWWSLTYDCAAYVYQTFERKKEVRKYFRTCFCPDELVVQTILGNSIWNNQLIHVNNYCFNDVTVLHKVEYCGKMKIWEEKDFDEIISSDKMFIRKATSAQSVPLLKKIDKYRKNGKR